MAYKHTQEEIHQEPLDYWTCSDCFKTISSSRPPIYNPNNCSCSEMCARAPLNEADLVARIAEAMHTLHLQHDLSYDSPAYDPAHQAPTITSDGGSIRAPEGPERLDPNAHFLPLGPATGLGEDTHRRRASFDEIREQVTFGLRCYLETLTPLERLYHGGGHIAVRHDHDRHMWLRQDTYLVGPTGGGGWGHSIKAAKGSSMESLDGSWILGSASSGWQTHGIDLVKGSGDWTNGDVFEAWPDTLMIDDSPVENNDEDDGWNGRHSVF